MDWADKLLLRLRTLFRRSRVEQELDHELRLHLEQQIEENLALGMNREEARHSARRIVGGLEQIKEECRDMRRVNYIENLLRDVHYGLRTLRKSPGFTTVAVLSLALGIGANTALFQLLDAVRLRSLPVHNPKELAEIRIADRGAAVGNFHGRHSELTNPLWERIRTRQEAFSGVFAWSDRRFNLATGGEAHYVEGLWVSGSFFRVLGVAAIRGRVLTEDDDRRGCGSPAAVISYGFWQRQFGGNPSAITSKLLLDGHPFEIIGVTPPNFFGVEAGRRFDVAVPICGETLVAGENSALDKNSDWWLGVIGRLKAGWSVSRANAHLAAISSAFFQETQPTGYRSEVVKNYLRFRLGCFPAASGVSSLRAAYEDPLWIVMGITGLVLLIACANLANLMLARASAREREISVRLAMGASRGRIVRQMLAESLVLALIGALLGIFVAQVLSRSLISFLATGRDPLFLDLGTDWRVLTFSAALAIVTCLLFGLAPALRATRVSVADAMKVGGRGLTADRQRFGFRRVLVISQLALSVVLFVGALLFVRSLRNLAILDAGFRQEGILIAELDLGATNIPPGRRVLVNSQLLGNLRNSPGIESAAQVSHVPITGGSWNEFIRLERPGAAGTADVVSNFELISSGYFRTMEIPVLAGRDFDDRDSFTSLKVAIVNEAFTRRFLEGANPLGRRFRITTGSSGAAPVYEIVGLVKNTKYVSLREDFPPTAFICLNQQEHPDIANLVVRSAAPLNLTISSVKRALSKVNPRIGVDFRVFKTQIQESLLQERLMATLSSFFGILAGLLATIGLYGVISYMVLRRQNEIGIRIALGADQRSIMKMVFSEAGMLLAIGLLIGTVLAILASKTAEAMLYGLKANDPTTLLIATAILAAVSLTATYLPARRAAKLAPMDALRQE
jgi:putative ABC transport system permease protein